MQYTYDQVFSKNCNAAHSFYNSSGSEVKAHIRIEDCLFEQITSTDIQIYKNLAKQKSISKHYLINECLYVQRDAFTYLVINPDFKMYIQFQSKSIKELEDVFFKFKDLIKECHSKKFIHYNISPRAFLKHKLSNDYCLSNFNKFCHLKDFSLFSPIKNSDIISPIQILFEMLHSKIEADRIEINAFKKRMIMFYNKILGSDYKDVPDICQKYFAIKQGAQDYNDYVLKKLCVIDNGFIVKSPVKVKPYLEYIDWFSFGIYLHKQLVATGDIFSKPSDEIINFIYSCLVFDPLST